MIGYLEGVLKWSSENKLLITVDGVGYIVEVPSLFDTPAVGKKINAYIYTYVREDAIDLYGFENMAERKLFKTLLTVSRIGPKAGMNILSALSYENFINAILSEKIEVLKEVSGIGPKTAQRLILELNNKIEEIAQKMDFSMTSNNSNEDLGELYEALNNLGYSNQEINKAVSNLDIENNTSLQVKIEKVLSFLGKESL